MDFRNHTPFPALAFEGVDQFDQAFHVFVLRQTLTWGSDGVLVYAEDQEPLCEVDEYFGDINRSSLRQESDLCHYKPRCDVILNATAHAPSGTAPQRCNVQLVVCRPDTPAPLPRKPQGLNQFVDPDEASLKKWRAAVAHAQTHPVPGRRLIDKALSVTGERELVRTIWPVHFLAAVLETCTFGLFKRGKWRLTPPKPISTVPLRYENAYGGECRMEQSDPLAKRLRKKDRLTATPPGQALPLESSDSVGPAALATFESNPVGRGYAQPWYLRAARINRLPAPQIEPIDSPFTVAKFMSMQAAASHGAHVVSAMLAGFGVRPKVHPERRVLAGTVDQEFAESTAWLPADFDFAIWNAAPVDQQTEFLNGDEWIELTNLCAPDSAGASTSSAGDIFLRLKLPGHASTLLVRMKNGTMFYHPMKIDTLIIEPDDRKVSMVWRAVLGKTGEIRVVEASLHKEFEAEFTQHIEAELNQFAVGDLLASLAVPQEESHG